MATISKRRRNEASILTSFSISKRNEPAYSRTCKDRTLLILHLRKIEAERTRFIPQIGQIEAKSVYSTNSKERSGANSVYSTYWKDRSEANSFYSTNSKKSNRSELGLFQIEVKNTNWVEVKRAEAVFLKLLWSPGIDSKELIPPAYALAGL